MSPAPPLTHFEFSLDSRNGVDLLCVFGSTRPLDASPSPCCRPFGRLLEGSSDPDRSVWELPLPRMPSGAPFDGNQRVSRPRRPAPRLSRSGRGLADALAAMTAAASLYRDLYPPESTGSSCPPRRRPDVRVGLSLKILVAVVALAVLKAGGAYVPLAPPTLRTLPSCWRTDSAVVVTRALAASPRGRARMSAARAVRPFHRGRSLSAPAGPAISVLIYTPIPEGPKRRIPTSLLTT